MPCDASNFRAWTSRRARRAGTRTARSRCTPWATWGRSASRTCKHIDRATYAGTSLIGKLGVESAFERQLHGTNGFREILVNAQGRSVERQGAFVPDLRTRAPAAGDDLVLSIDLKVQRTAEEALAGHRGAVVALDPNNGDVLALVSLPGFDPTLFGRGITRRRVRGPAKRHRQAAVQPRAARHLPFRLDHQAGDRACRAYRPHD